MANVQVTPPKSNLKKSIEFPQLYRMAQLRFVNHLYFVNLMYMMILGFKFWLPSTTVTDKCQ